MDAPLLSVLNAHKSYGNQVALRGVSFTLAPGHLVALLGPNGAGKTTLIRAICGRHRLDDGKIELLGKPIRNRDRQHRALLGFVPQDLAIYPDLTAEQNLQVFGRLHGVTGQQLSERVEQILEWTHLQTRRHDRAASFSGGMQRRLNIGCGVMHKPVVLLLDEPTVGVDPQSRERIFSMLDALKRQGTAILLTTHQLDEAQARSDRIVIIDQGRTIAEGTFSELIAATVGEQQRLTMEMSAVDGSESETLVTERYDLREVASELPNIIARETEAGFRIEALHLQRPTLQDVFLHLTGRELRE